MKRKLIRQGIGGVTLSLPIKWVRKQNLSPGDEIRITLQSKRLIVEPCEGAIREHRMQLTSTTEPFIRSVLNARYREGFDRIVIADCADDQKKIVKKITEEFLYGFEYSDSDKKTAIVQKASSFVEITEQHAVRKIFTIIKVSLSVVIEDLQKNAFQSIDDIKQGAVQCNLYDNYCKRMIYSQEYAQTMAHQKWELYHLAILIQSSIFHLYKQLQKRQERCSDAVIGILESVRKNFSAVLHAYTKQDVERLEKEMQTAKNMLYETILPRLQHSSGVDSLVLYYSGELSRLLYSLVFSIQAVL